MKNGGPNWPDSPPKGTMPVLMSRPVLSRVDVGQSVVQQVLCHVIHRRYKIIPGQIWGQLHCNWSLSGNSNSGMGKNVLGIFNYFLVHFQLLFN